MRRLLAVIARSSGLRPLLGAVLFATAAEHGTWLAVMFYAFERGGVTEAGVASALLLAPAVVGAPVVVGLGDRLPRAGLLRGALVFQLLAGLATVVAVAAEAPAGVVYTVVAVGSVGFALTRPLCDVLAPGLITDEQELALANTAIGIVDAAGYLVGPGLVGAVLAAVGLTGAMATAVVLGVAALATVLVGRLPTAAEAPAGDEEGSGAADLLGGVSAVAARVPLRWLLVFVVIAGVLGGAYDVATFAVLVDHLDRGPDEIGLLAAAIGGGGLVGTVAALGAVGRRLGRWHVAVTLLSGIALLAVPATRSLAVVASCFAISSAAIVVAEMLGRILVQLAVADEVLARVVGVFEGASLAAVALGALAISLVAGSLGATGSMLALGAFVVIAATGGARSIAGLDEGSGGDDDRVARLRAIPLFASLPPLSLRVLAHRAEPRRIDPGEVLFRRGEPGHRLWLVVGGGVEIHTVDGRIVHVDDGASFGEIAVVGDGRRSATAVGGETGAELLGVGSGDLGDAFSVSARVRQRMAAEAARRLADDGPSPAH